MKLITVSGPHGTGMKCFLNQVRDLFPGVLHILERNGDLAQSLEEARPCHFKVIVEATPEELRRLDLLIGDNDKVLRVLIHRPFSPSPHRLGQPVFDIVIHGSEETISAKRLIGVVGRFLGDQPSFFQR